MSVEVVHGDGVVPVAQVVLGVGRLLLPLHAAHGQQDGCGESLSQREAEGTDKYLSLSGVQKTFCLQSLCSSFKDRLMDPGWLRARCVTEDSLEFLVLLTPASGITGLCHHSWFTGDRNQGSVHVR